jgi:streptogramin lyase
LTEIIDRWVAPGPQPNGLQATPTGLWLIDQRDNHLYKLDYADGSIIMRLPTDTDRPSGVTEGGGNMWVASTYSSRLHKLDAGGATLAHCDTPGKGVVGFADRDASDVTGAHGMEWVDDNNMWIAVPPARKLYLIDPSTMEVRRSIPTPGDRPHGIFLDGDDLWCADTQMAKVHRLDPETGEVLVEIDVPEPEVHGMTLHDGDIWFCCAETRRVCTIALPA